MEKLAVIHPDLEDAAEITEMIVLCDIADHGVPDITLSDLLHMWSNIDIRENAWIVHSEMNKIIGYAFFDVRGEDRMDTCVFVHPEYKNKGIGSLLLSTVEERAIYLKKEKEKEMLQQLMNHIPFTNEFAKNMVTKEGYEFKRTYSCT